MADSQQVAGSAVVTQAKRNSYLRHVQIHMDLLRDSLAGEHIGCGIGQVDRDEIEKRLLDIWHVVWAAQLAPAGRLPAPGAPSGDGAAPAPGAQGGNVIPFRPRLAG